jgi:hypothetical protein
MWSKKDAETWPKWNAWLEGIADTMGPPADAGAAEHRIA